MRLIEAHIANTSHIPDDPPVPPSELADPLHYHYAVFFETSTTFSPSQS
jgi:hypothetical protein